MFRRTTLRQRVARLESEVARIQRLYQKTLSYRDSDPETALMNARKAAEAVCSRVFESKVGKAPKSMTLQPLIEKLTQLDAVPEQILVALRTIQSYGNFGSHHQADEPQPITAEFAQPCLQALGTVVRWYCEEFDSSHGSDLSPDTATESDTAAVGLPPITRRFTFGASMILAIAAVAAVAWFLRYPPGASNNSSNATRSLPSPTARTPPAASVTEESSTAESEKPRIAVLPFAELSTGSPETSGYARGIGRVMNTRFKESGLFSLVDRDRLDAVLDELKFSQSAEVDPSTAARIGRLLGAKQLVLGSFFRFGKKMRLDASFIDTETGEVRCSAGSDGPPDDIEAITHALCDELIARHRALP